MSATPRGLTARPSRSIPTTLLGIVMLILGCVAAWALGTWLITGGWPAILTGPINWASATRLDSLPMLILSIVLGLLGLAMLLTALVPGKRSRALLVGGPVSGQTAMSYSDIADRIRSAAGRVDGVQKMRVKAGPGRVRITVDSVAEDLERAQRDVKCEADEALQQVAPVERIRMQVHVRSSK